MTKKINRSLSLLLFVIVMLFTSCNSRNVFTDSVSFSGHNWSLDNVVVFTPDITDTVSGNNIFFHIRTGSSFPFRNIYLFVSTTSPSGITITDTLQYMLADEKGKWFGKGAGDIHELRLPFKASVYFPIKGTYSFRVRHGMRDETLKGVYDFGLRIEKSSK
jgi:gliding motility-associated lipoprotein GldH